MKLINYPSVYHREYEHDVPDGLLGNYQKTALSLLPLLALHSTFQKPMRHILNGSRCITHLYNLKDAKNFEILYESMQGSLASASLALAFFKPSRSVALSTISDAVSSVRKFYKASNKRQMLDALMRLCTDVLFLASITHGGIEFTVLAMLLQLTTSAYQSIQSMQEGEYLAAGMQLLFTAMMINRIIPQAQVLHWKHSQNPNLNLVLKADEEGFIYLDGNDADCRKLHALLQDGNLELPPYFKPGLVGSHISVMWKNENIGIGPIKELGQTFAVRIHGVQDVRPLKWQGVSRVKFLTVHCPELDAFRASYGLPERLGDDYDWHFTLGIEKTSSAAASA